MLNVTLSRLARCARWVEGRVHGEYVELTGVDSNGRLHSFTFLLVELNELLAAGKVTCESSPRIYEAQSYEERRGKREEVQKYWSVAGEDLQEKARLIELERQFKLDELAQRKEYAERLERIDLSDLQGDN